MSVPEPIDLEDLERVIANAKGESEVIQVTWLERVLVELKGGREAARVLGRVFGGPKL